MLRSHLESVLNVAHRDKNCASSSGWGGEKGRPPVLSSAAALLDELFERPARRSAIILLDAQALHIQLPQLSFSSLLVNLV